MTTIIDGSAGITFPNSTVQASAGSVLQVVNATLGTAASTTSGSFVAIGLSASITPKFSTSKIFVLVNGILRSVANNYGDIALYRNGSLLTVLSPGINYLSTTTMSTCFAPTFMDSPATASSTSYSLYFLSPVLGNITWNPDSNVSSITLMEIAQ